MAPKRRAAAMSKSASHVEPSELAAQHGISETQESEIREAFSLFSLHNADFSSRESASGVEGVLRREDVRRCLTSLGIQPSPSDLPSILDSLDPTSTNFVPYDPFLELAAIFLADARSTRSRSASRLSSPPASLSAPDDDNYAAPSRLKGKAKATATPKEPAKRKGKRKSAAIVPTEEEVVAAYQLFTKGSAGPITLSHLRRVARELKEDVGDDLLRDMILEANGEMEGDREGWRRGVGREEFEGVMRRAGVFG